MITEKQRIERKKFVGSSDASAIVGCNPWMSALDLYYDKTGMTEDKDISNDAMTAGTYCETAILNWFQDLDGISFDRDKQVIAENNIQAANFDGLNANLQFAVEAKMTRSTDEWGEVGTNEVPDRVMIQVMHQMAVVPRLVVVYIPVLFAADMMFRQYEVRRDDELIKELTQQELHFWHEHVAKKIPPAESAHLETLKKLKRVPNKKVEINPDTLQLWLEAKIQANQAVKEKKAIEAQMLSELGDAEQGDCDLGTLTYFETVRKGYEVNETCYRTLRYKKPLNNKPRTI